MRAIGPPLLCIALAAACAAPTPSASPTPTTSAPIRSPGTAVCPVTVAAPAAAVPQQVAAFMVGGMVLPSGMTPPPLRGMYGNDALWVDLGTSDGTLVGVADPEGHLGVKFPTFRLIDGSLTVSARRLDGPSGDASAAVPEGYGSMAFQAVGLSLPSAGCWSVTETVAGRDLVFILRIVGSTAPPAREVLSPPPLASPSPSPTPLPAGPNVQWAGLLDAHDGWALTSTGLFLTADGGRTWRAGTVPGPKTDRGVLGVTFADAAHGWLATLASADPRATVFDIWRTSDGARTWTKAVVPEGHNTSDLMGAVEWSILDADHVSAFVQGGMAEGYTGDLYVTTNGGRAWSPIPQATDAGVTGPLAFADPLHSIVAGGAPGDRLFRTADGGRTWALTAIPLPAGAGPDVDTQVWSAPRFWSGQTGAIGVI